MSRRSNIYLNRLPLRWIAVVGGTGERRGPFFENRDIRAMALRITTTR
jgi:hypothetical protein